MVKVSSKEVSPEKEQQVEDSLFGKLPSVVKQQEENNDLSFEKILKELEIEK
jgi:hypothetical protein